MTLFYNRKIVLEPIKLTKDQLWNPLEIAIGQMMQVNPPEEVWLFPGNEDKMDSVVILRGSVTTEYYGSEINAGGIFFSEPRLLGIKYKPED